jgi:hypothetical protein
VLHARVRKCGWSSSNTASLSACEQYLTQVYGERNRITTGNSKQKRNVKFIAHHKVKSKKVPAEHGKKYGILQFQEFFPSSFVELQSQTLR